MSTRQANGSLASSSLWAAVSQISLLGVQALAALAILLRFGKGVDTDAVFAAYGVYGVLMLMCQTLRLTVVARVVQSPSQWAAVDRFLGAGLSLLGLAAIAQLAAGAPIARLLTGDLGDHAEHIARVTLALLWLAVGGQLVAALGAAVLAIREEFRYPGLAFVVGGITNIAVLLGLSGPLGIYSVAVGVVAGSLLTAAAMTHRLWRIGYRPQVHRVLAGARELRTSLSLVVASASQVMTQVNFVISLSFAARLSVGDVTLYTIAFFGGAVVIAVTASAAAIVLAAPVAQTWDGNAAALLPHLRTIMRAGLMLIGPAVALALLVGDEFIDLLLGSSFSAADANEAVAAFAALTGLFVGILATQLPLLAAYAQRRYGAVAALSVAASVVHVGASAIAVDLGSIAWLGAAASVSALTGMVLMMWLVHGADAPRAVAIVVRECAVLAVACLVAFGPVGLGAAALGGGAWDLVAAIAGLGLYTLVLRWALPGHAAVAHRMLEPVLPARMRPVAA